MNWLHVLSKWKTPSQNLELGQLVLLKDGNDKYIDWKLARISKTHKGDDELVPVIELNTSTGILGRNINFMKMLDSRPMLIGMFRLVRKTPS